ncbi:MAG: sigma-70 family RNA polymerase sigma factor, partial [Chloroflexota bacterium]
AAYRGDTKFTTWLYRLVVNLCLDELRRRGRAPRALDLDAPDGPAAEVVDDDVLGRPEDQVARQEARSDVRRALATLPSSQRLALTLCYFEDLRYEDVAAVMGLPVNTVKSHIRRGKERLASLLTACPPANGMTDAERCHKSG